MALDPLLPLGNLSAPLAVERLRRRTIATATGWTLTDPGDHTGAELTVTTTHRIILAVRRKAGAAQAVRPIDATYSPTTTARSQWLYMHIPAALVPAGLVWTDLYAGAPVEWARVDGGGAAVALTPAPATMTILAGGIAVAAASYASDPCCEAQPLAVGDALMVVAARYGGTNTTAQATIRVELADE